MFVQFDCSKLEQISIYMVFTLPLREKATDASRFLGSKAIKRCPPAAENLETGSEFSGSALARFNSVTIFFYSYRAREREREKSYFLNIEIEMTEITRKTFKVNIILCHKFYSVIFRVLLWTETALHQREGKRQTQNTGRKKI